MDLKKNNTEILSNLNILSTVDIRVVDEIPTEVPFYVWKDLSVKSKKSSKKVDVTSKSTIQISEYIEESIITNFRKFCNKSTNIELVLNKTDNFYSLYDNLKKCFDKCSLSINQKSGFGGANSMLINPKLYHLLFEVPFKELNHKKTIVTDTILSNVFKTSMYKLTVSKFVKDDEIIVYRKAEFATEPHYIFFTTLVSEERRKKYLNYTTFINHKNRNYERIQIKW